MSQHRSPCCRWFIAIALATCAAAADWRDLCDWRPGCTIWLSGSAYQQYILDPETGIAKNVTDWPVRPW